MPLARFKRTFILMLACATLTFIVSSALSPKVAASNVSTLPWLRNVEKVERVLIGLATDLTQIGKEKNRAKALAVVRKAEKAAAKAIALHKSGAQPPSKYSSLDGLLARSLTEYRGGLRTVDRGFVHKSNKLIAKGLRVINKGNADQDKFANKLTKVTAG